MESCCNCGTVEVCYVCVACSQIWCYDCLSISESFEDDSEDTLVSLDHCPACTD